MSLMPEAAAHGGLWWVTPLALCVALVVDHRFGEPPVRVHPVVWMGNALDWAGKRVAPLAERAGVGRNL